MRVYARREPTTDWAALKYCDAREVAKLKDVAIYADLQATQPKGRFMWFSSARPTRRNDSVVLNCARYDICWLPDLEARGTE